MSNRPFPGRHHRPWSIPTIQDQSKCSFHCPGLAHARYPEEPLVEFQKTISQTTHVAMRVRIHGAKINFHPCPASRWKENPIIRNWRFQRTGVSANRKKYSSQLVRVRIPKQTRRIAYWVRKHPHSTNQTELQHPTYSHRQRTQKLHLLTGLLMFHPKTELATALGATWCFQSALEIHLKCPRIPP